jgi:hypothetical protein
MSLALALALFAALGGGCKSPGTISVAFDFDDSCVGRAEADQARVYLVRNGACETCACGDCFDACTGDATCAIACDGGFCAPDELAGLEIEPPAPGAWALVVEYYVRDSDGAAQLGASACALIELDEDGTESRIIDEESGVQTACCVAP